MRRVFRLPLKKNGRNGVQSKVKVQVDMDRPCSKTSDSENACAHYALRSLSSLSSQPTFHGHAITEMSALSAP